MIFHVIDDQPVICEFISAVIDSLGHESSQFLSAVEYLNYLDDAQYRKPDAIFTDISMPLLSGPEMVKRVREVYPDQKFIIISGRLPLDRERDDGACFILNKPFVAEDIVSVVRSLEKKLAA